MNDLLPLVCMLLGVGVAWLLGVAAFFMVLPLRQRISELESQLGEHARKLSWLHQQLKDRPPVLSDERPADERALARTEALATLVAPIATPSAPVMTDAEADAAAMSLTTTAVVPATSHAEDAPGPIAEPELTTTHATAEQSTKELAERDGLRSAEAEPSAEATPRAEVESPTAPQPSESQPSESPTESQPRESQAHEAAPTPPPAPPPPDAPPATPPAFEPPRIDLEQWLGVRGAAALGAIVLVIAALFFFQYGVEHGLIGPAVRVALGLVTGLACVVVSERPLRATHETLADWLAGAGFAILYASTWAAGALFHLVPTLGVGVALTGITAACSVLAVRRHSMPIALLGLLGGFATPLAISTGEDRPIPLFGYLFLLDVALLGIATRRRWPALALVALGATALYELSWIFTAMDGPEVFIGLVVTVAFAMLFVFGVGRIAGRSNEVHEGAERLVRIGATLLPLALGLGFAARGEVTLGFVPTLILSVLVTLAGLYVGKADGMRWLRGATAGGAVAFAVVHLFAGEVFLTELALIATPIVLYMVAAEVGRRSPVWRERLGLDGLEWGQIVSLGGGAFALMVAHPTTVPHFAIATAFLGALTLLAVRWRRVAFRALPMWIVSSAALLVLLSFSLVDDPVIRMAVRGATLGLAGIFHGVALVDRGERAGADQAANIVSLATIGWLPVDLLVGGLPEWSAGAALVLHVLLVIASTARLASPHAATMATTLGGGVSLVWSGLATPIGLATVTAETRLAVFVAFGLVGAVLPVLWPRLRSQEAAHRASALAMLLTFLPVRRALETIAPALPGGVLPVLYAVVALGLTLIVRRSLVDSDDRQRSSALAWMAGATTFFVTTAIPLQLANEWVTIGWALEAAVLLALFRRIDHPGLKYVALGLYATVAVRLLLNPYVLGYYERSDVRIFNWLSYTYLVPALALFVGAQWLSTVELVRRRPWESFYARAVPWFAAGLFALGLAVVFGWVHLTIFDWFATSSTLTIPFERLPARDLAISIAWAVFALVLLALGVWRRAMPLRVASLALMMLTALKVFLYDLSNLRDLYRVAALVGLALSLIVISLAYRRFVFTSSKEPRS